MFSFKPAVREQTPLVIGLAGPTKSGKTYSAHRLAQGLANGGVVAMLNMEGPRGHQYADKFKYVACDLDAPFSPSRYTEAIAAVAQLKPAVLIIDSVSHMHDGPGGMLEYHDTELDRLAGNDFKKRDRVNFTAWIKPKADENKFIYAFLGLKCPVILCFRAKEKLKIVPGKDPVDLGWQPIGSDKISFETIFTLMLPPHCKGVPDLSLSDMREPFDTMIPSGKPVDEQLGRMLAKWAEGGAPPQPKQQQDSPADDPASTDGDQPKYISADQVATLETLCQDSGIMVAALKAAAKVERLATILEGDYERAKAWIERAKSKTTTGQQ